ncbi:hypothetical protein B9Z19DRAFT_1131902 [Tuber borchii]|uniref:Uncharacterized protein n=1 Tax=Tuber borchii TaxID=42251 RepID=A0A2T6ZHZ7_TUBBO|nr:hypothetical protein B9Z19DRAFT_1131902 [Tuber borchii]
MAFMKRVEIRVRKPAPIEAPKEGRIESNGGPHPPVHPQKKRPTGSVARKTAKRREPIIISSPEAPPPKKSIREKAKSSVGASKPKKRKAEVLESSEEERRPAKSLAVPLKFHKKKSTPSSLEDDKIHSPEVGLKKSRPSLTSRAVPASPHSIQHDGVKKIVRPRPILDPLPSAKGKANPSIRSDKKAKEKPSSSSANSTKPKKVKRANADPEDTRSLKTSTVRKGFEKNVLEDEDSDVPISIRRRREHSPLSIHINGEVFLPPKLGEGTAQRPTKEAMRKEALDKFALRLKLAKSDFLALCRSRDEYPTRKDLDMRAFPKDFQFEPFNQTPRIPPSPEVDRKSVTQAEAAYAYLTGNWSPGGADIENIPKSSSKKKKKNHTAKTHETIRKEEPKARKKPRESDSR